MIHDEPRSVGPSPRARGAACSPDRYANRSGTIPACAGSSAPAGSPRPTRRDHPRVRGEQGHLAQHPELKRGPSPRARGAVRPRRLQLVAGGTIPACAGSRPTDRQSNACAQDHPRVRGEQLSGSRPVIPPLGPSPRARGAGGDDSSRCPPIPTIPACAGSRRPATESPSMPRDHPRVRGEQGPGSAVRRSPRGPSPRARGAGRVRCGGPPRQGTIPACAGSRAPAAARAWRAGTIPACAGSRPASRTSRRGRRDHPRVRGEQSAQPGCQRSTTGPSPRARGADPSRSTPRDFPGTIPACAGSSGRPAWWPRRPGDHPRVRGEQPCITLPSGYRRGPSPRARGAGRSAASGARR